MEIMSEVLLIVSVLSVFVNIITEVAKNTFSFLNSTQRINFFVLITAEVLTLVFLTAYFQFSDLLMTWYIVLSFFVVGILVAYASMFGYDKLYSYIKEVL